MGVRTREVGGVAAGHRLLDDLGLATQLVEHQSLRSQSSSFVPRREAACGDGAGREMEGCVTFSGAPSRPSCQMYSALCASAFTLTMQHRPTCSEPAG